MSAPSCPRLFEAEATRDGRLSEAESASFRRHLTACAVCAREVQALEALARAVRSERPGGSHADELRTWRERTRLLSAWDRILITPQRRRSARRWLVLPLALTALVAGWLVFSKGTVVPPLERVSVASVQADSTAVWSQSREAGDRERVTLARGTLWIHVGHPSRAGRFQVVLPDGELDDIGTIFAVTVAEGHTMRVAVLEGSVVLRLRGRPVVTIGPGQEWIPDAGAAAPAGPSAAPATEPTSRRRLSAAPRAVPPAPRLHRPVDSAPPVDASVDFRAAIAALRAGDNRGAAAGFTAFVARHPADRRAEDAAYLRVIALQRSGAGDDMQLAAREYLRLYPRGFRRADVESLLR
ncbi:MAG TPA: FecR domain-containing protein [Polyangia bacterium]|nr:FecR domain-containing protein [Polyangia bacterium]